MIPLSTCKSNTKFVNSGPYYTWNYDSSFGSNKLTFTSGYSYLIVDASSNDILFIPIIDLN